MMMNPWPMIRAALSRYRFSALAFVALVAAGVMLSVAIVSQERALRGGSARAAERFDLIVAPPGSRTDALLAGVFLRPASSQLLSPALSAALLNDPRAGFVSPLAFGDSHRGAPLVGVTAALVTHLSAPALAEGRVFAALDEVVVGAASPLKLGERFHPTHGVQHGGREHAGDEDLDAHAAELVVVGRMQPTGSPWDRALLAPVERVWTLHGLPGGHAEPGRLGPPFDAAHTPGIPAAVLHTPQLPQAYKLRRAYTGLESMAFFPAEALLQLYDVLGDMRQLMSLLALVTQGLVLLSIIASVFILFRLLLPQFITLRALGAPRRYVFAVAWGFSAALMAAGVALGLLGGYALSFAISRWLAGLTGIALQPSLGLTELLMALALLAVGLVLAALPAWRLQRLPLAQALKDY